MKEIEKMKIRLDFVTNSSSSCFLILTKNINNLPEFLKDSESVYLDKKSDLAKNFISLLTKSLVNDFLTEENTNNVFEWIKFLNLDKSEINLLQLIYSEEYLSIYSPEIIKELENFLGYYLIFYRQNCWNIPDNFKDYFGDNLILLREDLI